MPAFLRVLGNGQHAAERPLERRGNGTSAARGNTRFGRRALLPPEPGQTGGVEPTAGIEVTAAVPPVGFALNIVQPQLQLDDLDPVPWRWGSGLLAVVPGPAPAAVLVPVGGDP